MRLDTWMFDFFKLDDANGEDGDAGHDDDRGRDKEGVGVVLEAAEQVHSKIGCDGGRKSKRNVHGLHVQAEPQDPVANFILG